MTADEELAQTGAILVEDRVLRRIIKQHRRLPGIGLQVPHAHAYTIARTALAKLVEEHEVALALGALPERVVVFTGDRAAIDKADARATTAAWRAIFHGRVHQAFEDLILAGKLTQALVRERINRIGQIEFDEVRDLLRAEDLLLPPGDDIATYTEFAALYLELHFFEPISLERTFSTMHKDTHVLQTLQLDLDPAALLASARPPRAPTAPVIAVSGAVVASASQAFAAAEALTDRSGASKKRAAAARKKGNDARAAIMAYRAGELEAVETDLEKLCGRLARALAAGGGPAPDTRAWIDALFPLARVAAASPELRWTAPARLFLDLQAACTIFEREIRVVDFFAWLRSRGKRPIVRALPATREVRIAKRIHAAVAKLPGCDLPTREDRERLADVLHGMTERADAGVRTVLRPAIERALDGVELRPQNLPEQVAEKKIVDEMLDQAVSVGRLTFANLRDAVSANELKLPDLERAELWNDDQLLRADRALSMSLDGVYRRGEVYLRFLQKLSSVLFATPIGRLLCLYLLLPAAGAFGAVMGAQHIVGPILRHTTGFEPEIARPSAYTAVGVYLFLLLHVGAIRRGSVIVGLAIVRGLRIGLFSAPAAFFQFRVVRAFLDSGTGRWFVKPVVWGALAWLVGFRLEWWARLAVGGGILLVAIALINTRTGRLVQEVTIDALVRSSRQVVGRFVPGLIRAFLDIFSRGVEMIDRGLYRVDEMLRFRVGASRISMVVKGVLGTFWFLVTYLLRIALNVFIEPVFNPVKHFPTVTVAGKLLVPFYQGIAEGVTAALTPVLGRGIAGAMAAFSILMVPGFAGFLVWELKANWKLYAANRSSSLQPSAFGHHGETVTRFMRPGFHSGTIPKLFAKLRRATWKADERGIAKQEEALHHVAETLEKFTDRELVSLLVSCKPFAVHDIAITDVDLASNRVRIELACPSLSGDHAVIAFEQQSGFIVAGIVAPGWIEKLDAEQRQILEIALAGFYKLAAVDIVREQIAEVVGGAKYDISDEGLIVWPGTTYQTELVYDLRATNLAPVVRGPTAGISVPSFINRHALYAREVLRWPMWATTWETLAAGASPPKIVAGPTLLPPAS